MGNTGSKKIILIALLLIGAAISALVMVRGSERATPYGSAGGNQEANRQFGTSGNERPMHLREVHALLTEHFSSGLQPLQGVGLGSDSVISASELRNHIGLIGIDEGEFNSLISMYFAPSPGVPFTDDRIETDTRPIELRRIHTILTDDMGVEGGLRPISHTYVADHTIRVGVLWIMNRDLGLTRSQFEELIDIYFGGEGNVRELYEPEEEIVDNEQVNENWLAVGEVYSDDLVMTVFELFNIDMNDFIRDLPVIMALGDFQATAHVIGLMPQDVFEVYKLLRDRGDIVGGQSHLSSTAGGASLMGGFAGVGDEPSSTMSAWAVDGFLAFESHLPGQLAELIRHNPRGHVTTNELNSIVLAMYNYAGMPTNQVPQWPHESVVRGQAIHVIVDAYINILIGNGGDPLSVMTSFPDMEHFDDYVYIDDSIFMNVSIAYYKGWMTGMSETFLGVNETFERQQVIAIAYRALLNLDL